MNDDTVQALIVFGGYVTQQPVVLCILDGVGLGRQDACDAVFLAKTPTLNNLMNNQPWGKLKAHGTAVGLPSDGDMGNSEVGHNAMGAGRVFDQGAKLINTAFDTGSMWASPVWQRAVEAKTLHFLGLLSDGNVHSHIDHLLQMITQANTNGVQQIRIHMLTDGRDVAPRSVLTYISQLETHLATFNAKSNRDYRIATGGGRMWMTMDRYEADWSMIERGWKCHMLAEGTRYNSATEAVQTQYDADTKIDDQWLKSFVIGDYRGVEDGDAVILFNFRGDRAIEISSTFDYSGDTPFAHFDKSFPAGVKGDIYFAGMMEYDGDLHIPANYLVAPPVIDTTVGEQLANANKRVFALSETQKFGHVTFFFNGNRSGALPGETQQEIASLNVPFNQAPRMKALEVTEQTLIAINSQQYDHIRLNIANGDMVGHTGDLQATIEAVEFVDECVGRIVEACTSTNSILIVTADHGNADEMAQWDKKTQTPKYDEDGNLVPSTAHSTHPVPFILFDPKGQWTIKGTQGDQLGGLSQIGASLLELCGVEIPDVYLPSLVHTINT